jgi:hypothetical protein
VAVLVGGTAVGVSVGGRGVKVGDAASVGGILEGRLVLAPCVPEVTQPASARMMKLNKSGKYSFLVIISSFDQSPWIIASRVFIQG